MSARVNGWMVGMVGALSLSVSAHAQSPETVARTGQTRVNLASTDLVNTPWFQRFTAPSGSTELNTQSRLAIGPKANLSVVLETKDGSEMPLTGRDEVSAGAYWRITPRVQVGSQLSIQSKPGEALELATNPKSIPEVGVKLQSSFKF